MRAHHGLKLGGCDRTRLDDPEVIRALIRRPITPEATVFSLQRGDVQTVRCDYIDYERDDGQVLSIAFWPPNDREISHGRRIGGAALTILPGS